MSLEDISERGRFCVLAVDHRDALRSFLSPGSPETVSPDQLTGLKIDLVKGLAPLATGVMLEPEYSIPEVIDAGALPPGRGFIAALEAQGYAADPAGTPTTILDGWSVQAAADSGASAAKLLLPFRPDAPLAARQVDFAGQVLEQCRSVGIPLVLEPLFFGLADPADRLTMVLDTARTFMSIGPDVLKLPFPVDAGVVGDVAEWRSACDQLGEICNGAWTLLSGGGSFELYERQLAVAVGSGCAGCMVGRALWGEAATVSDGHRQRVIENLVVPRMRRLRDVVLGASARQLVAKSVGQ